MVNSFEVFQFWMKSAREPAFARGFHPELEDFERIHHRRRRSNAGGILWLQGEPSGDELCRVDGAHRQFEPVPLRANLRRQDARAGCSKAVEQGDHHRSLTRILRLLHRETWDDYGRAIQETIPGGLVSAPLVERGPDSSGHVRPYHAPP